MPVPLPETHLDLFTKKAYCYLGTMMTDGTPQVTPVWVDTDGEYVLINTSVGRLKDKNMTRRAQVGMTIQDPDKIHRYLLIQGHVAEIVEDADGAREHIEKMSRKYDGAPYDFRPGELRRLFKISPEKVAAKG